MRIYTGGMSQGEDQGALDTLGEQAAREVREEGRVRDPRERRHGQRCSRSQAPAFRGLEAGSHGECCPGAAHRRSDADLVLKPAASRAGDTSAQGGPPPATPAPSWVLCSCRIRTAGQGGEKTELTSLCPGSAKSHDQRWCDSVSLPEWHNLPLCAGWQPSFQKPCFHAQLGGVGERYTTERRSG